MANKIASRNRVNGIIEQFENAGFTFNSWTEDGEYDSPKVEFSSGDDSKFLVGVERDYICVTQLDGHWNWWNHADVTAYLKTI